MKQTKRIFAVLLAVVMLFSVLPLGVFAVDTDTVKCGKCGATVTVTLTKEPTCTAKGRMSGTCSNCGATNVGYDVKALGHEAARDENGNVIFDEKDIISAQDGIYGIKFGHCSRCGVRMTDVAEVIPADVDDATIYGTDVNLVWMLDSKGTLTINGDGEMPDFSHYNTVSWKNYKNQIVTAVIVDGVTSIGSYAFYGCSNLTSVMIPDSVTSIGDRVFSGCSSLTSVTIPDSVTSIGRDAFDGCSNLTRVDITDLVAWCKIHFDYEYSNPLYYAHNLYLNDTIVTELMIPDGVTSIGDYAFVGCSGLTSVTIPDSVTSIGDSAFSYCSSLTSVTIPDSVTSIGYSEFEYCSSLTSVTIPDGVTSIGNYAFCNCSSLTSVTIPDSVTSIGDHAFGDCNGLTRVEITDLATWCSFNFSLCDAYGVGPSNPLYYARNLYLNGTMVTDLTIPEGVTSIGEYAFFGCNSLTNVTISDSVTSIGNGAFEDCSSLTSVTIPDGVTSIGGAAFHNCSSLTSVTIPDGVTSIGISAFSGCGSLTSATIGNSVTSIGNQAFYGCNSLTDVYYDGSVINFLFIDIGEGNLPLKKANFHFHEHEIAEVTSVTPATCTEPGIKTGVCACGQTLTEDIPALGHSYVTTVTPATCTTVGYTICECERGDHRYVSDIENALGHTDPDANGNCAHCGIHLKDAAPTSDPTNPSQPSTQEEPPAENLNFFQRIIQWFRNLFARLFGRA